MGEVIGRGELVQRAWLVVGGTQVGPQRAWLRPTPRATSASAASGRICSVRSNCALSLGTSRTSIDAKRRL